MAKKKNKPQPKPKYKKDDKVRMVIDGYDFGIVTIKSISHFKGEWWYNLKGFANPSEQSILKKLTLKKKFKKTILSL